MTANEIKGDPHEFDGKSILVTGGSTAPAGGFATLDDNELHRALPSALLPVSGMRTPPICLRRFPEGWINNFGFWNPT